MVTLSNIIKVSPFEQFQILILQVIQQDSFDISITNNSILMISIVFIILITTNLVQYTYSFLGNNYQISFEFLYDFAHTIVSEQAGRKAYSYFPHIVSVLILILFYNLLGLTPFSFTVSSQIIITFTLALSFFIAWVILGILNLRFNFFYLFCPRNMPMWLLPLLVCIELLSFCLRPVSLGVRLFANMLAGHILLHILANATAYLYKINLILLIPALIIVSAIFLLELGISFLQAYIFTILLTIYLKDSLISH